MIARDLVSKLLAAGLSAGLFLLWWPQHHSTVGLDSLVVRGALWTLSFEMLLLTFAPLERLATQSLRSRISLPRPRIALPRPARIGGACVLACAGAALPIGLLSGVDAPQRAHAAAPPVRKVVVVKHLREKVVVREVVREPAVAAHPAPPIVETAPMTTYAKTKSQTKRSSDATTPKTKPAQPSATTPKAAQPSPASGTAATTTPPSSDQPVSSAPQADSGESASRSTTASR